MVTDNDISEKFKTSVELNEVPAIIFDFYDTLEKIKNIEKVIKIYITSKLTDIFVVTEEDDVDLSEKIMNKFSQWETSYKLFPELHIINKNETFYIPKGSYNFNG